jgi:hypothetical protein
LSATYFVRYKFYSITRSFCSTAEQKLRALKKNKKTNVTKINESAAFG